MIATCALKLKKRSVISKPKRCYDVGKLQSPTVNNQNQINRFSAFATDEDDDWDSFKDTHSKAAEEVLGFREFTRSDWISGRTRSVKRNVLLGLVVTWTSIRT